MLYLRMLFSVDGTIEYGQTIRKLYLWGFFGKDPKAERKTHKLDWKNYKKWRKINQKPYSDYLDSVRV